MKFIVSNTIKWLNNYELICTVTATDASGDSGGTDSGSTGNYNNSF